MGSVCSGNVSREKNKDRIRWEIVLKRSRVTELVIDRDEPPVQPIFENLWLRIPDNVVSNLCHK
jgi:hypothetical protein